MHDPILRATDAASEVYDDPSEDALFMLIEDLEAPGSSVFVERMEPGREGESARVSLQDNGLYRLDAGPLTYVGNMRVAHELLSQWAVAVPEDE